ncbi:MAG: hypothetical protein ACYCPT_01950 [Acidimicrobiales bacterium]
MFLSNDHLTQLSHLAAKSAGLKGHTERVAEEGIRTAAIVLSTGGMAYLNGRYSQPSADHVQVAGVPVDLAGGLFLTGLSLAGMTGKFAGVVASVGAGGLGAYAARMGTQWGATAKLAAAAATPAIPTTAAAGAFAVGAPKLYPTVDAEVQHQHWSQ